MFFATLATILSNISTVTTQGFSTVTTQGFDILSDILDKTDLNFAR